MEMTLTREGCIKKTSQSTIEISTEATKPRMKEICMTKEKTNEITKSCLKPSLEVVEETVYANDNLEEFILIWYGDVDDEEEFEINIRPQLREIINYFKRFRSHNNFFQFIQSIRFEQVFVILANCDEADVEELLGDLNSIEQVTHIYFYSPRKTKIKKDAWLKFRKFQEAFTNIEHLIRRLMQDVKSINILSMNVLKIDGDETSFKDLTNECIMFLRSKLFIDHLLSLPSSESGKRDLILQLKKGYEGNPSQMANLDQFELDYCPENAIKWYTSGFCIYKIINKALRLQDMKTIFDLRCFITDLYNQLSNFYSIQLLSSAFQAPFIVYRGTGLPVKDLDKIKSNVGSFISMNSFLSTSRRRQVANIYAEQKKNGILKQTLFEMTIEPHFVQVPFANITDCSIITDENEILFSLNSIFKIESIFQDDNYIWHVKLSTSAQQNEDLRRLITFYFDNSDEMAYNISLQNNFGKLLCSIGEYEMAKQFYEKWLCEAQYDHSQRPFVHTDLGHIFYMEKDFSTAFTHYIEAYTILQEQWKLPEKRGQIRQLFVKVCDNLANFYIQQNDHSNALNYYRRSFEIEIDRIPLDYRSLTERCVVIASSFVRTNDIQTALTFYSIAIRYFFILSLKDSKVAIHDIYFQIANIYQHIGNKTLTLKYINLAFDVAIETLSTDYTKIVTYKKNKEIANEKVWSSKIEPVILDRYQIFNYNVEDLITFERNDISFVDTIVIWLKPRFNGNNLPHIGCAQKIFLDGQTCQDYIFSLKNQAVFLVLSNFSEDYFIDTLYNHQSVVLVYISTVRTLDLISNTDFKKIRGPIVNDSELLKMIGRDIEIFYSKTIAINVFNGNKDSANNENVSFIKYHTFIKLMLMRPKHRQSRPNPISFYNFELNKAILQENIPEIYKFHTFIENVHTVIDRLHKLTFTNNHTMSIVYYSGHISPDKFVELQQNIGAYVSVNNFIHTYYAIEQAFGRAVENLCHSFYVPIIIQFNVNTYFSTDFSFAPLSEVLDSNDQGLVFSLGSIFRLDSITRLYHDRMMYYYITLSWSPVDPLMTKIFNQIKLEIGYDWNRLRSCGRFFCFLNKYDEAEEYFGNRLHQVRSDDIDQLISVNVELGDISAKNSNLQQALDFYNKAIEIQLSSNENTRIELANIHRKIGNISLNMGKKRKSLNNYLRAIEIQTNHVHQNQICLGLSFIDIGLYYTKNGQYQNANHYFKKALACLIESTPRRDNYLSLTNFYLGITNSYLKKYSEAIKCHINALFIYLTTDMSYNRQYIKSVNCHLGLNYFRTEKYDEALICFGIVIEKETDMLHSAVAYYYMGSIYYQRGRYEQSLESYLVSLENTEDISMKANVSHNIAIIYMKMNSIDNSIAFFDQAFKFELEFVSKKYPFITQYYSHTQNVKDKCILSNEVMRDYHHELDIVTQLFESYNQTTPTTYEVICFDPDNMSYCFRNLTRLSSRTQIIEYLRTCKTQIIFIIVYSHLNIQLNYTGKTIYIYLFKLTNDVVFGGNIRGCFNDMDHLLIELTKDIVVLGTNQSYNERRMNNQIVSNANWRKVYINRFEQILLKSVPVQEGRKIHRTYPKKKTISRRWRDCFESDSD